jgi:hypothetical protein
MALKIIKVAEATEAELRQFANDTLGLSVATNAKADSIRAKIAAAYDKAEFAIEVKESAPVPIAGAPATAAPLTLEDIAKLPPAERDQYFVTVLIIKGETPDKQQPVTVSVNGRAMWIERGKPSPIRWPYFHALQNAIQINYHQEAKDPQGNLIGEEVPSYPYQVLGFGLPKQQAA